MNKIIAHRIFPDDARVRIQAAPREREWMDNTQVKYAYRCLPLAMANQLGWSVYPNNEIELTWDGRTELDAITVNDPQHVAASIFGYGIITFHIMHLIQTPPGVNLYITGQPNQFIPGIQPLTGYMETDWSPYTFTMNWQMTHPGETIRIKPEHAICHFFPVARGSVESTELEISDLSDHAELADQHDQFVTLRNGFYGSDLWKNGQWQKNYFQGKYPDGSRCPVDHQTKINLKGPK